MLFDVNPFTTIKVAVDEEIATVIVTLGSAGVDSEADGVVTETTFTPRASATVT